jgi:hypothetical protein
MSGRPCFSESASAKHILSRDEVYHHFARPVRDIVGNAPEPERIVYE